MQIEKIEETTPSFIGLLNEAKLRQKKKYNSINGSTQVNIQNNETSNYSFIKQNLLPKVNESQSKEIKNLNINSSSIFRHQTHINKNHNHKSGHNKVKGENIKIKASHSHLKKNWSLPEIRKNIRMKTHKKILLKNDQSVKGILEHEIEEIKGRNLFKNKHVLNLSFKKKNDSKIQKCLLLYENPIFEINHFGVKHQFLRDSDIIRELVNFNFTKIDLHK